MTSGEIITIVAIIAAMVCFIVWRLTLPPTREPEKPAATVEKLVSPVTQPNAAPFTLEAAPEPTPQQVTLGLPAPSMQLATPTIQPGQAQTLIDGMHLAANRRRLRIVYKNSQGGVSSREIRPRWVFVGRAPNGKTEVIRITGHCYNAGARRTFRLDRMKRVTTMGDRVLTDWQAVFAPVPIPPATLTDQPPRLYSLRRGSSVGQTEAEEA